MLGYFVDQIHHSVKIGQPKRVRRSKKPSASLISVSKLTELAELAEDDVKHKAGGSEDSGWAKHYTEAGELYFYNRLSGMTSWIKPGAQGLQEEPVDPFSLIYQDVQVTIDGTNIVGPISGIIDRTKFIAIMGPSGCGKSTLLRVLAGKSQLPFLGAITVNGIARQMYDFPQLVGFVPQGDILDPLLTVFETLTFYAGLRMSEDVTQQHKQAKVQEVAALLGLTSIGDLTVGDDRRLGISGGQKKRLSIAKALIGSPFLLFNDEPTSGLSSNDSLRLTQALKNRMLSSHCGMVSVYHQPRMEVFELFDEVILLTQGLVAYHGNCSDLESLLTELDVPRPRGGYTSLADFSLDVISIDCPQQRIEELTQHFTSFQAQSHYNEAQAAVDYALKHGNLTASAIVGSDHGSSIWSMFRCSRHDRSYITSTKHQFLWLFNLMQLLSTRGSELYQRVANSIVMSLIIGIMFLSVDAEDYQVKGSVLFLALLCPSMSCLDALPKYVQSRVLFNADNSDGLYSAFAYYAATSCVYLFLGLSSNAIFTAICYWMCGLRDDLSAYLYFCLIVHLSYMITEGAIMLISISSSTAEAASAWASLLLGYASLFSGLIANPRTITPAVEWMLYMSPCWYAFELLCINEFGSSSGSGLASKQVIINFGMDEANWNRNFCILAGFLLFYRILGYSLLKYHNHRPTQ